MRKLLTLAMIFACMFTFAGCNDDDEKEEQEVKQETKTTYTISHSPYALSSYTDIYIFEFDKNNSIVARQFIARVSQGGVVTIEADPYTTRVECYSQYDNQYWFGAKSLILDSGNDLNLFQENITEEEYHQRVQQ